jgi:hypothetical protein
MIILGIIGWVTGINPAVLIGGAEMVTRGGGGAQTQQGRTGTPEDEMAGSPRRCSATPRTCGTRSCPPRRTGSTGRPRWCCSPAPRPRAAARAARPWGRSTAPSTRRSTSTSRSSRRCSASSAPGRLRLRLRARPRGGPPRGEPARDPGQGAAAPAGAGRAGVEPALGAGRTHGRLLRGRSGPTTRTCATTPSSRATSRRRSPPRRPSATTGSRSSRRATRCPTPSPTAPPSSGCAGS